jgi:F-type H+-transporting ATPase subunit c
METGLLAVGAGLSIGLAGLGVGLGQGILLKGALEAMGRNPEAAPLIRSNMFVAAGIAETAAIYGLLIAFTLISKM